jgi:cytoskeletal protein CcmA (bactofilin family)
MTTPTNFITEDTTIKGNITTASSLTVAGAVEGDINAGGEVDVRPDAVVKGDLSGPNVKIDGTVEGRITASGKLVIGSKGKVHGDISVRSLLIEEGGTLEGQCHMGRAATEAGANKSATKSSSASTSGSASPVTAPPLRPPTRA